MYTASDLRKGLRLKIDGDPYVITEFNFVKPGKGQALYRTKLKNMINGNQFERTFRSVDNFEPADLREKKMQYLYKEGNKGIIFTDCAHACYVEFGTGVVGSANPHPTLPWEYDVNGHGENGWYYYDTDSGKVRFTKGLPSRPFMYETSRELEKKAIEIAKEVFAR